MASSSVPWLLVSPLLALTACAGWPRFADPNTLPPAFVKYPVAVHIEEGEDFAPQCDLSGGSGGCDFDEPDDRAPLDHLFEAGLVRGTITSSTYNDQEPFDSLTVCEGTDPKLGINGRYGGDLDFVQVGTSATGLCLVLAPGDDAPGDDVPDAPPELWDVVVYPYDAGDKCIPGDFLSRGTEGLAASTHMGQTNFALLPGSFDVDLEYLVLVGIPEPTSEPWPYELYLLPTRDDPRSCLDAAHEDLTAEDFEEIP
jgi:hypothetical protein